MYIFIRLIDEFFIFGVTLHMKGLKLKSDTANA